MGLSDKGYSFIGKEGSGNNRVFTYYDENNNKQTINVDTMKSNIASKNAQDSATTRAEEYIDTFEGLSSSGAEFAALAANNTSESFTDYLAKNFTADQLTDLTDGEMTAEDA
jgi:predicted ABC-type ATPase